MHFDAFLQAACRGRDLDWRKYRRASRRKVLDRIYALGLKGYGEYLRYLETHPQEAAELPNLLRVTVSRFFRERKRWQELAERVFPQLIASTASRDLHALSLGSCGGEEPYSLALLWIEYVQPRFPGHTLTISGAEVDSASLARAEEASYQARTLREVPDGIRERWFRKEGGAYRLDPRIKDMVRFEKLDLLKDPLPSGEDLLLCRYLVFTYFKGQRAVRLCRALHEALNPEGILMIGTKEGLGPGTEELFEPLEGSDCFFRKRSVRRASAGPPSGSGPEGAAMPGP